MYEEWWITCVGLLMFSAVLRACLYYRRTQATTQYATVYVYEDPTVPIAVHPGYPAAANRGYPAPGQVLYGNPQPAPGPYPYAQPGASYGTSNGQVIVVGVPSGTQ